MILVDITSATLCFLQACHPILLGENTPIGEFKLEQRIVLSDGYGGDVLQFSEDDKGIFAIHRVWLGNPKENRLSKLTDPNPENRKFISNGCINIDPKIYDELVDCCSGMKLIIK